MPTVNTTDFTLRYTNTFSSLDARVYKVQIYDRKWDDPFAFGARPFQIAEGGLQIKHEANTKTLFAPIVGSKCSLDFMFIPGQDGNSIFFNDLLGISGSSYLPYNEGDIMLRVSVLNPSGAYDELWFGEYLMDLDTLPDMKPPFPMRLTFTDGIGKMKDIEFKTSNVDTSENEYWIQGYRSFASWISRIIQHTKYYKNSTNSTAFWNDASNTIGYHTAVRWYNADFNAGPGTHNSASDPLKQTKGQMQWTRKIAQGGDVQTFASAYEVLRSVCVSWGMRCIFWGGVYRFYQIYNYKEIGIGTWTAPDDIYTHIYYANGSWFGVSTSMGDKYYSRYRTYVWANNPPYFTQKAEGAKYKFLPVLREVKAQIMHPQMSNIWPLYDFNQTTPAGVPSWTKGSYYNGLTDPDYRMTTSPLTMGTKTKLKLELVLGFNMPSHAYWTAGWQEAEFFCKVMACSGYIGQNGNLSTVWLANLEYDPNTGTTSWRDASGGGTWYQAVGPHFHAVGGPYYDGPSIVPFSPILEFPGYRDDNTWYAIHLWPSGPLVTNINGNWGVPPILSSPAQAFTLFEPYDNTQVPPPTWQPTAVQDNLLTKLSVIGEDGTTNTATTITTNSATTNSVQRDLKQIYWADGPDYYSDAALQINTPTGWTLSNWLEKNWAWKTQSESLPSVNAGWTFVGLLMATMKACQDKILKQLSCTLINDNQPNSFLGYPTYTSPMAQLQDAKEGIDGGLDYTRMIFMSGTFNLFMGEFDSDWIEMNPGTIQPSTTYEGGPGGSAENNYLMKTGGGTTTRLGYTGGGSKGLVSPRLVMLQVTSEIAKDVAIDELDITHLTGDGVYTGFNLKEGDKVYLKNEGALSYELTLTADVTSESTKIEFTEITPDSVALTNPQSRWWVVCNVLDMYEQTNRKTRGTIGGMTVTSTTIDGAKSLGREYVSMRAEANAITKDLYYTFYGEDNNKSGRMNNQNTDAPSQISGQLSLKAGRFLAPNPFVFEGGKIALSGTATATATIKLYRALPVDNSSGKLTMTELASAQVELQGNSKPRVGNMTILADNKNIAAGELIIPHVIISGEEIESGTFRGQIAFTLIRA